MIELQQYNGNKIDLLSLLNENERKDFLDFYWHHNSWASAVVEFLGKRQEKIGNFIGDNNEVFLDCGAHCGFFSLIFQKCARKIYAIEPLLKNFDFLSRLTRNYENIIPHNIAIGTQTKQIPLFIDNVNETQTSLIVHPCSREYTYVDCVSLKDFCEFNKIDKIDFLKLDIEGFELPLIMDSSFEQIAPKIQKMHCEVHNIEDGKNNIKLIDSRDLICERLRKLNFNVEVHDDELFCKNEDM